MKLLNFAKKEYWLHRGIAKAARKVPKDERSDFAWAWHRAHETVPSLSRKAVNCVRKSMLLVGPSDRAYLSYRILRIFEKRTEVDCTEISKHVNKALAQIRKEDRAYFMETLARLARTNRSLERIFIEAMKLTLDGPRFESVQALKGVYNEPDGTCRESKRLMKIAIERRKAVLAEVELESGEMKRLVIKSVIRDDLNLTGKIHGNIAGFCPEDNRYYELWIEDGKIVDVQPGHQRQKPDLKEFVVERLEEHYLRLAMVKSAEFEKAIGAKEFGGVLAEGRQL